MKLQMKKFTTLVFHRLRSKFAIGFCILAIFISACSCIIGYTQYKSNIEQIYNTTAYAVAHEARSLIDGDKLRHYANTLVADDDYFALRDKIETLRSNMDAVAIFIVQLNDVGEYLYIMDTIKENVPHEIGDSEKYDQNYEIQLKGCYYDGKEYPNEYIYYNSPTYGYNSFVMTPIYDSNNDIVSILMVQSSVQKIKQTLHQYLLYTTTLTIILVIVFLSVYLTYLNKTVIYPIKKITLHTQGFIKNSNTISSNLEGIHTGDEIETLADSIKKMENDIHNYINNLAIATATKEHISAEINVAKKIQQTLFPCQFPAFPERSDFDIYAELHNCDSIGGNFYNFFLTENNQLCILLGDVSGNGIPTSMFSIIATTLISNYASQDLSPDKVLSYSNNELVKSNNADFEVDVFLAIIDLDTEKLSYATAGNMNVLLKHPGSAFETIPFKKCFPLAAMEQVQYVTQHLYLSQGDILFLHSKGITEATNNKGMLMGSDYVKELIANLISREYSLEKITKTFYQQMENFQQGTPQTYDSSVLLFRYIGK